MRPSPVELRRATPADVKDVADVFAASCRHAYQDVLPPAQLAKYVPDVQIPRWTEHFDKLPSGHRVTAAFRQERVIGFIETRHTPHTAENTTIGGVTLGADVGEVTYLFVDPRHIGTGVGRLLLAEGERHLTATGAETAILWVFSDNRPARAFYEGSGWTWTGHEQLDAGLRRQGYSVREQLYSKALDKPMP
ncbi:GNAT family N-acetyltransferase [Streptomyces naphthomycinicus]|uniref:GNAT family N-acetyltransferase n=1 Tax=Streptomyces naphthomycinicus TaxID=2872625 RepID=UPI001CEC19F1|nr:GNAT family N-acetyltransferase [Streptomyces sp. TML10]